MEASFDSLVLASAVDYDLEEGFSAELNFNASSPLQSGIELGGRVAKKHVVGDVEVLSKK